MFRNSLLTFVIAAAFCSSCTGAVTQKPNSPEEQVARGRYLTVVAGCNDCHTPGYIPSEGKVPESQWLTGDSIGFRGPWGTTYPINLRLLAAGMEEDQWVTHLRTAKARPPMPYYALWEMTEDDLRALHRYIRSLGAAGEAAPAYVPPDSEPTTAFFEFVPQQPKAAKVASAVDTGVTP